MAQAPRLVSVEKIWDRGPHNAFTDLARWHDRWYCVFREAEGHVGGDGKIRVLTSPDGLAWSTAALVAEEGIDLRDPKLSVTPDDRLMLLMGGSVYRGGRTLLGRQPRVAFSADGRDWSAPRRVLEEGDWLWRVTWHDGRAYGVSYRNDENGGSRIDLCVSRDGLQYERLKRLEVPDHPNEATLRFQPDGTMLALVRREAGDGQTWYGRARPPYQDWELRSIGERLGGPNFVVLPMGSVWAAGRSHANGTKTVVAQLTSSGLVNSLVLPSGGDTSYPGLVLHDGLLWMSYYSSHEGKAAIYLAKIELPAEAVP
jgi:hypothetical protein